MKKILALVILWGFLFRIGVLVWRNADYWYDEAIVTNISKQETNTLLRTISSEPHPPGFYFILKLFPVDNPVVTRVLLLTISVSLLVLGVFWAAKNIKSWNEFVLGTCVFLLSYGYLWSGMDVKQAVFALPLWIWWMWIWIKNMETDLSLHDLILGSVLAALVAVLDYRYLAATLVLCVLQWFGIKKKKMMITSIFSLVVLFVVMSFVNGGQFGSNLTRFSWIENRMSSTFLGVSAFFMAIPIRDWAGDLIMIFILAWLFWAGKMAVADKWLKNNQVWRTMFLGTLALWAMASATRSFVTVRYPTPFYFLLCLIIGWGMYKAWKAGKMGRQVVTWSLVIICMGGAFGSLAYNAGWFSSRLMSVFADRSEKTGFVTEHPNFSTVFLARHTELTNVVGINVYDVETSSLKNVTKEVLDLEGLDMRSVGMDINAARERLLRTGIKRFVYMISFFTKPIYDVSRLTFSTLGQYCEMDRTLTYGGEVFVIVWDNCNFEETLPNPTPTEKVGSEKS